MKGRRKELLYSAHVTLKGSSVIEVSIRAGSQLYRTLDPTR
jgi:hypothetical protein